MKVRDSIDSTRAIAAQVLLFLQRGGNSDAVLSAYGEFYAELVATNHASWQDLLLDEVRMLSKHPTQQLLLSGLPHLSYFMRISMHDI